MKIKELVIDNYRSVKHAKLPFSNFSCIIGQNNAGKSTILLALSLFYSGSKLKSEDFYNSDHPTRIQVTYENVTETDLMRIPEEHRIRISEILVEQTLKLVRIYDPNGSSKLLCRRLVPSDQRFQEDFKGRTGAELKRFIADTYPDYATLFDSVTTQKAAREVLESIIDRMKTEDFEETDSDLPTGIQNSVIPLLPEPIYIPAVKDISDDVKMKESATMGKLVGILMRQIERAPEFQEIKQSFSRLNEMLNRVTGPSGDSVDTRIEQVRTMEGLIEKYIRENFPRIEIELQIPPPELKQVFSSAQILVDDGVKNGIDVKGDGLKRSVTFALIRSYVEMRRLNRIDEAESDSSVPVVEPSYLFLFEEPELYLHPSAQTVLFEALERLAGDHQVITTTHSPLFFSPTATGTFIKVIKRHDEEDKPFANTMALNLQTDMSAKDAFQVICYENNNAAFFAERVVLVEGDSDVIYFKHIAKILDSDWDFDSRNIPIVRMGGKGNAKRYREYFETFGIDVHTVVDLDALIGDFNKLNITEDLHRKRSTFLKLVDSVAEAAAASVRTPQLNGDKIKKMVERLTWRQKFERLQEYAREVAIGNSSCITPEAVAEIESLFSEEADAGRKQVIFEDQGGPVLSAKLELLNELRKENVYVLSKGAIEQYYPSGATGDDKPSRALNACRIVQAKSDILNVCPVITVDGHEMLELEAIFSRIFE